MRADAPVRDVGRRTIGEKRQLLLWVRAGGRCEFDGCNEYLFKHHVTLDAVKLAQIAHIVAFKPGGPRGNDPRRPDDIHAVENLMLLCHRCHALIDDKEMAPKYTREQLQRFKQEHEERIFRLTGAKPERKTTVIEIRSKIGGQVGRIPPSQVFDAIAPMYPADGNWMIIDLSSFDDDSQEYYSVAITEIARCLDGLYRHGPSTSQPQHLSVFGLAPMPLLMFLGSRLSNKVPVELFQRHRDSQDWVWKEEGEPLKYSLTLRRKGKLRGRVALVLSLSAALDLDRLPAEIDEDCYIYEITLKGVLPSPTILRSRADLAGFRLAYHEALSTILRDHGAVDEIAVFPAVPAPVAITCGFELLPKVSPRLRVFENDLGRGGWSYALTVGRAEPS